MFHKRLLKEFSDNRKYVAGMVIMQWAALLANVALMYVLAAYVGRISGIVKGESLTASPSDGVLLIVFAAALFVRIAATSAAKRMSYLASTQVKRRLRDRIYEKMMEFGAAYREAVATSEAVQIATEGVDQLEIYFGKYVPQFFYSMLAPLTLFVIVGTMSIKVAAVLLLCVPLIPVSIVAVQKFAKKLLAKYWGTYTELGDSFLENLQGLVTLKIYQADGRYAEKMDEEAEKFRKVTMRVLIMQLNSISVMDLVAYGGAALGIILSVLEYRAGAVTFAECFFIIMISAEFFLPLRLLGSFFHIAMNGNAAADKIFRFLDTPVPEHGTVQKTQGNEICFSHVNFAYTPDAPVLRDVDFSVPEGRFVALVGESGCGKSTIASLVMGENRPKEGGSVTIGGVPVTELTAEALYRKVTRVRHDSYLFAGTVEDNLRMGKADATQKEMEDALLRVDLLKTIREKGGLAMQLEERAANLSGGQKQRVAIARALAMDPKVMLLDEPTSALDPELVGEVLSVIRDLADGGMTMIMATHQMDFARALATDILFMEQGKIIEQGAPDVLLAPGSGTRTSDFCGKLFDLRGTEKSDEPTVSELLTGDLSHDITDDGSESSMIPDAPKKD